MGILDRVKKKREDEADWLQERIAFWRQKYEGYSEEELRQELKIINRKALLESIESPYRESFFLGGLKARNMPEMETEIQRQIIVELLKEKKSKNTS